MTNPTSSETTQSPEMEAALKNLLQLAGLPDDAPAISPKEVQAAVDKLKTLVMQLSNAGGKQAAGSPAGGGGGGGSTSSQIASLSKSQGKKDASRSVLLAGQLGIITHQLKQNLSKHGAQVMIARDVDDAIVEYQKQDYSLVVIDLFMPTEREGLIVLDEIKKLAMVCNIATDIIILAPSSKDKSLRDKCINHGANLYLEKAEGWHNTIAQFYLGEGDFEGR